MSHARPFAAGKVLPLLLLALLAGCAGLGTLVFYLQRELDASEAANLALRERLLEIARQPSYEPFQAEARKWRERAADLEEQIAAAASQAAAAAEVLAAAPPPPRVPATPTAPMAQMAAMLGNPTLRDLVTAQQERVLLLIFSDLLDRLRLPQSRQDRLVRLLVDKQMAQMDYGLKALDPQFTADQRAGLYRQWVSANAAADEAIRALLDNPDDFAYYQTYLQQQPERLEVSTLDTSLTQAGYALTAAQREALVALMYDARREFPFTEDFYDRTKFTLSRLNGPALDQFTQEQRRLQETIATRAAALLSAEQMVVFRRNQAAMREFMRSQMQVARDFMSGGQ